MRTAEAFSPEEEGWEWQAPAQLEPRRAARWPCFWAWAWATSTPAVRPSVPRLSPCGRAPVRAGPIRGRWHRRAGHPAAVLRQRRRDWPASPRPATATRGPWPGTPVRPARAALAALLLPADGRWLCRW